MTNRWICTVCNYVHEGPEPPGICPVCGVGKEMFEPLSDEVGDLDGGDAPDAAIPVETLEQARDRARERLRGICAVYPHCDGDKNNICQREAYGAPIGLGGAGLGHGFAANFNALKAVRLRTRLVGPHFKPDTSCDLFGVSLSMPVMVAPTSGVSMYNDRIDEREFCQALVDGALDAGTVSWRGDTHLYTVDDNPALDAIEAAGGKGVATFKPRAQAMLKALIARAEAAGCPAVAIDLDGCGSTNFARAGQPVFRKSPEDLAEIVGFTKMPVVFKGIMDPDDAEACVQAGAQAICVSNHGGRVLDSTPGVAEVLPAIAERIAGRTMVVADGGVRTGYDALKMLALGADAVLLGRDPLRAAIGGGREGVRLQMERLGAVLRKGMLMTGCAELSAIDREILY